MGRLVSVLVALGLVFGAALAPNDPPDVRGYSPTDAEKLLLDWSKAALIKYEPPLQQLNPRIDPASVVVVRSAWVNQDSVDTTRPQFVLTLGSAVPDVRTLPLPLATEVLHSRGLAPSANPPEATPEWTVARQRPLPGELVEFGFPVSLFLEAPVIVSTEPPVQPSPTGHGRGGLSTPVLVGLVTGGSAGLFVLVLGVGTLALRRAARRRGRLDPRRPDVSVQGFSGQVVGPDLVEAGPSVAVRLEPHVDPGTVSLEEVRS
jgi:hypothetical protein